MEASLQKELERTTADRSKFVSEFSEEDYNYIVSGWQVNTSVDSARLPDVPLALSAM